MAAVAGEKGCVALYDVAAADISLNLLKRVESLLVDIGLPFVAPSFNLQYQGDPDGDERYDKEHPPQ